MLCFPLCFFLLCHAVQCRAVERCVVLCRDVLGLCCPVGLIKADRLHYSSNEICQRRQHSGLARSAAALLTTTQEGRGGDSGEERVGRLMRYRDRCRLSRGVYVCVCVSV